MSNAVRNDADNLKALQEIQPRYERLRTARIRVDADIERFAKEYEEAKAAAEEMLGTSDEAKIRDMIQEARAENTQAVDEFIAAVRAVEADLAALDRGPA